MPRTHGGGWIKFHAQGEPHLGKRCSFTRVFPIIEEGGSSTSETSILNHGVFEARLAAAKPSPM